MLTIEQAQSIADLRRRMLDNISNGKPPHDGIKPEEISQGLDWIRQNRAVAGAKGGKAKAKKDDAPASAVASLDAKLKALGINLD